MRITREQLKQIVAPEFVSLDFVVANNLNQVS